MFNEIKDVKSWKDLDCKLSKNTLLALKKLAFKKPTQIQALAISSFLKRKDVVAQAVTGSGKTLAYIIPIIELLNRDDVGRKDVFCIILTPTSELASQAKEMFDDFLQHFNGKKPKVDVLKQDLRKTNVGNSSNDVTKKRNKDAEKGNILDFLQNDELCETHGIVTICTPGSLDRLIEKQANHSVFMKALKKLQILILDEADRLLDMGFETQLGSIIKCLPKQRLTGLFSATQSTETDDFQRAGLRLSNAVRVCVKENVNNKSGLNNNIPSNLRNYYITIESESKLGFLVKFLQDNKNKKILVFFSSCNCVDFFSRVLRSFLPKHHILALHKKLKNRRQNIFKNFKSLDKAVMLSTDVMARGVDIPNIDWVIQFDPPKVASDFLHRAGRTARCDQSGNTLLILRPNEDAFIHFLERNQTLEIEEYNPEFDVDELDNYHERVKDLCVADRLMYEKSIRAFVSFIQHYKKHQLKYIFKLADLNIGQLGNSFGLLRMPQMSELRGVDLCDFKNRNIDLTQLKYKDKSVSKVREITRKIKEERRKEAQDDINAAKAKKIKINSNNKKKPKIGIKKAITGKMISEPMDVDDEYNTPSINKVVPIVTEAKGLLSSLKLSK